MVKLQRADDRQASADAVGAPGKSSSAHIPVPLTSLIGRERDVEQVAALLASGHARLVTLTGPGGVGKTRLALQLAARSHRSFTGGVYFVPLASVSNPDLVLSTITQTLGVREAQGQPLLNTLCAALRDKHLLLILDNFEQIVAAAEHVAALLSCAPTLHVLVTSRTVLRIYGEHEYQVATLALPDTSEHSSLEQLTQYEAVRLFIERARAARPNFTVDNQSAPAVAGICHRLDGLPLAIELAAARVKLLSPQALLNRLDPMLPLLTGGATNLPLRHQTLHNAIAWSYDLLTEREKRLFRIISVFVGGFSLEGAAAVYDESGASEQRNIQPETPNALLDELTALIDKSLLRHTEQDDGEPRFAMLETIREFASEQLAQSEEAGAVAARHARYFMELAERAEPELLGPAQSAWLDTLAREHDNIRSTLLWTQKAGDAETGLRLSAALFRFWFVRGYWSEGRKWLVEALEHGAEVDAPIRAKALIRLGNLAGSQSDYEAARKYHTQALAISEELGDKAAVAVALSNLGNTARLQGDYARSIAFFEQSLEINKELGQKWHVAMTLRNLSVIAREQGRYEVARRNSEEALLMQSDLGDKQSIAISLSDLGTITASEGDLKAARTYWEQSLSIWQEIGDKAGEAGSLQALGEALAVEGDYQAARALQAKSLRARYEMGTRRGIVDSLQGLAVVEQERAEPLRLARLLAAAEALRAAIGSTNTPQDRARYEPWLEKARARLGPQAFTAAWEEGKRLTTEQVVALALEGSPGDTQPDPSLAASTLSAADSVSRPRHDLTHREIEVLRLIAAGLTNHDIAAHLHVSINTLQTHIRSIYSKINVTTRTAAVRYAFEHDLS